MPKEGATGWSDTWMIAQGHAEHQLRVQVAGLDRLARGERPGRRVVRRGAGQREGVRADRGQGLLRARTTPATPTYWKDVYYWTTPTANCLDGRTDVKCVPYSRVGHGVERAALLS